MPPQPIKTPPVARPATKPVIRSAEPDIFDDVVETKDLKSMYLKVCLYGENRVGKTTLACQFEKPIFLISAEPNPTGGALSTTAIPGVYHKRVDNLTDLMKVADTFKTRNMQMKDLHIKTVVLDSATSIQDLILKEMLNLPTVPEMLAWGMVTEDEYRARSEKTREALRPFLNLPCHTIITAKMRDHRRNQDRAPKFMRAAKLDSVFGADLGGATAGWLHDTCDYLGHLYVCQETEIKVREVVTGTGANKKVQHIKEEVETGRAVRRLRTMYHPNYIAGCRAPDPSKVPEYISGPSSQQMYQNFMKIVRGE